MPPLPLPRIEIPTLQPVARPAFRQEQDANSMPEDESSVLADLARGGLEGLGYVGSILDKVTGSRALRGVLGGNPRELLSILPFSDTLGITRPEDITSGKEVFGIEDNPDSWWDDIAGFGAEVLLDPTLPLTGLLRS